ncbi:6-phosphogluconolactonase [Sphingomonas solaris]|uniref:6-phosphogluconolactonase n=1 Tax=Alterirhizorhabdus solaris TaxID=2529389 RepID=A0A558QTQ2_9SPHN|nr:6-phosphogluconolactonase [Sphingomonas solaris]TVV70505.1 6-phosphogluconolactonase [Sphingomonas solaris]
MIEAEWWEYDDEAELAEAVAGDVAFIIESALDARGQALVAFPGGSTPPPVFAALAKKKLKWKNVTIIPTDERLVAVNDPLSNVAVIAKTFIPLGARVLPIGSENKDHRMAGKAADARLQDLHWPPDLVWLGVGADGHTASIFPGADLDEALNAPKARRAVGVMPEVLPAEAPVARVTLTRAAILSARAITIVVRGKDKREMLEKAIKDGPLSPTPVGRVLADAEQPIDIHWCA